MRAIERLGGARIDLAIGLALSVVGLVGAFAQDDAGAHSALIVAVTLPVAWRRRAPLAAAAAFAAGMVVSALPSLDAYRCGAAIPAALLLLYTLGSEADRRASGRGLALVLAAIVFLTFTDPLVSPGAVGFLLPLCAGVWAAGLFVASRNRLAAELAERSRHLERRREQTASLAVEVERMRLTAQLDRAARRRVEGMVALADAGEAAVADDPDGVRAAFAALEAASRASLNEMRELLGALRSDTGLDLAPTPTLDHLDALIDAARAGGREVALAVDGPPRPLAGGVELAAYRLVQHVLAATGQGGVRVSLHYRPGALLLEVGAETAAAQGDAPLAVVRERVRAHGGRLDVDTTQPGRTLLRAELPAAHA